MQQALLQLKCLSTLFQQDVYKPLSRTKSASPQVTIGHHKAHYPIHQKSELIRPPNAWIPASWYLHQNPPKQKTTNTTVKLNVAPFFTTISPFFLEGQKCDMSANGIKNFTSMAIPKNASKLGIVVIHGTNCRFSCRTNQWHIGKHLVVIPVGRNPTSVESF